MKIHITTNQGTVIETIELDGYDFEKPFAQQWFMMELLEVYKRGKKIEEEENA